MRGIAARKKDTPLFVRRMQEEMIGIICGAATKEEIVSLEGEVREIYNRYYESVPDVPLSEFVIRKKIGRESYNQKCIAEAVISLYRSCGVKISAGMDAKYVVRDAGRHIVDPEWNIKGFDIVYYRKLLDKAAKEVFFVFSSIKKERKS